MQYLAASSVEAFSARQRGEGSRADHWEEPAVDTANAFFADDGYGAVDEPAVSRVWTLGVVDEFRSVRGI